MHHCAKCGASGTSMTSARLPTFDDVVLENPVTLVNVVDRITCKECNHFLDLVPDQEGLIAAVALCRVQQPYKLNGREIRLLRIALGLKGTEFAKKLSVTPEAVSRWENSNEIIGNQTEKYLRLTVALGLKPKASAIDIALEDLMAMDIVPMRPTDLPTIFLEQVKLKEGRRKHKQWDKADDLAA